MKPLDHKSALELRFNSDAGDNITIRDYLYHLLATLWHEGEGFDGKHPFGNSGWESELYRPLVAGGYIDADEDGYVAHGAERDRADKMIEELMYFALYGKEVPK